MPIAQSPDHGSNSRVKEINNTRFQKQMEMDQLNIYRIKQKMCFILGVPVLAVLNEVFLYTKQTSVTKAYS